jgi:RNA polymerase sigma-70 factor (ECF subfamily)
VSSEQDHQPERERLRSGHHDAFERLYHSAVKDVFAAAFRMTGDRAVAEEITSETFLVAWRSRGSIDSRHASVRGWLMGIAVKQTLNHLRSQRRRNLFLARFTPQVIEPDFSGTVAGRIDDAARLSRLPAAMQELTRAEASVVGLCVWSDLTYAEAAEVLGIPVGTVRSRLARARERLRRLTDDPPDEVIHRQLVAAGLAAPDAIPHKK